MNGVNLLKRGITAFAFSGLLAAGAWAQGTTTPPTTNPDVVQDTKDIRQDKRDIHQDTRDIRQDRRDVRSDTKDMVGDRKDLANDRTELQSDEKNGASA